MLRSLVLFCLALILAACQAAPAVPTDTPVPTAAPSPTLTPTPFPEEFSTTVQVGEYAMDIRCRGSGEPTIILENGLASDS